MTIRDDLLEGSRSRIDQDFGHSYTDIQWFRRQFTFSTAAVPAESL